MVKGGLTGLPIPAPAKPPNDYSYSKTVLRSALLHDALASAGVADVKAVWAHEIGGARMFTGHARQAGHNVSQCGVGAYLGRYTIVVDDDIDPSRAVATRTDPEVDINIIHRAMGSKNDPMAITYKSKAAFSGRAIIDACRPYEYLDQFSLVAEASPELQAQIRKKWKNLLEQLRGARASGVTDALGRTGVMDLKIKPLKDGMYLLGPAITVDLPPGDNLMLYKALQLAKPGDVQVVNTGGQVQNAIWGELMTNTAKVLGLGGLVVDGVVRDGASNRKLGFPIFCRGTVPVAVEKDGPGFVGGTISRGAVRGVSE